MRFLQKIFERVLSVVGAFVFLEMPRFMDAYQLILKGHLSELSLQIQKMEQLSLTSHQSFQAFIHKFLESSDPDFQAIGHHMLFLVDKETIYKATLKALEMASIFARPWVFIKDMDPLIVKETMASYTPMISISLESIIYATVGALIGFVFAKMVLAFFKGLFLRRSLPKEMVKRS